MLQCKLALYCVFCRMTKADNRAYSASKSCFNYLSVRSEMGSMNQQSSLHEYMKQHHCPRISSSSVSSKEFSNLLQECADSRDIRRGLELHSQVIKLVGAGLVSVWNKLLNVYSQCGMINYVRHLFDGMPERDIVSFNVVISAYTRDRLYRESLNMYSFMQVAGVAPNHITVSTVLRACGAQSSIKAIQQIHAQALKYYLGVDKFVMSSLVDCYAKCKRLVDARLAFDDIVVLDVVSWNIMIAAYVSNDCYEEALKAFMCMCQAGMNFDSFTMTTVLGACVEPNHLEEGKQLHACMVRTGLTSETPIGNALITMYAKCGAMQYATQVFSGMKSVNIISCTAMISGFAQNDMSKDAAGFYQHMLNEGVRENEYSFASILTAFSSLSSLQQAMQVHARILKSGFESDLLVRNALIDTYSKCGSLTDALSVFRTMDNHDKISCTTMIGAFAQHGMVKEALDLFKSMKDKGLHADDVTYLSILSACSHCGFVDEGLQIFQSMNEVHGIKPRQQHYACMIDMLGRAGRLEEAENLIYETSIESDAYVWETLLGACSIHGDMKLGIRALEKLKELGQEKDGSYVLLANIYAEKGLWEEKGMLRWNLEDNALKKEAGSSWVVV